MLYEVITESRELTHRPELPPVHVGVDSPGVGKLSREPDVGHVIQVGDVVGRVHQTHLLAGHGG